MHDSVIGGAKAGVRWTSAFVTTSLEATGGACKLWQPSRPWILSRSQLSCSPTSWQKEQMRAAIVHACCQQAVEKLQETAEQQAVSLISSEFPESCSRLPFTMLEKSPLPDVRSNLIAAAGDLAIRLWDLLEPWTSPLCARKGNVKTLLQGDRALGCQDSVPGHAVYHLIPGIVRHLWDPNGGLEEESFHAMMRLWQPSRPWILSRSQLSCSPTSWQKEQMRAAIVHACCQQAVEKLQETAEQQAVSLISSEFPESCSRLPFTMLEKSPLPDVRSNLIAAAGDLAIRLWDLPEPWTSPLCARKGNVKTLLQGDRALGCQDSVPGHAVYHLIPGIVRHLWDPNGGLEEESFHAMMRHLLSFLPKGK
ncbi:hypothetical protein DUI87_23311 [Hirundo rustica rustica]|uniref:Condensin complex subunit 1 C-terminal domain-containing protein n=1 Tax=Hirundo rustica rustica TaxID=333673 RepID=A0A3M0JGE9_HIRRU|nr:hypothetical protein DUI87_23311 [Hirundo rustica rustica]